MKMWNARILGKQIKESTSENNIGFTSKLINLENDNFLEISKFLDLFDILSFRATDKENFKFLTSNLIWRELYLRDFWFCLKSTNKNIYEFNDAFFWIKTYVEAYCLVNLNNWTEGARKKKREKFESLDVKVKQLGIHN